MIHGKEEKNKIDKKMHEETPQITQSRIPPTIYDLTLAKSNEIVFILVLKDAKIGHNIKLKK